MKALSNGLSSQYLSKRYLEIFDVTLEFTGFLLELAPGGTGGGSCVLFLLKTVLQFLLLLDGTLEDIWDRERTEGEGRHHKGELGVVMMNTREEMIENQ